MRLRRSLALMLGSMTVLAAPAVAQSAPDSAPRDTVRASPSVDADRATLSVHRVQQNAWISGGFGAGGERGAGIAAIASAWYAYGHAVLGARTSEGAPWMHETDTRESAVLVGARARTRHTFVLAAVGGGQMSGSHSNGEQSGSRTSIPGEASVAFGVEAGVTYHVIGLGVDLFGAKTSRLSYSGAALVLQLGYLE